eukprot:749806-Lingulodinium_polyedra.AAC.1
MGSRNPRAQAPDWPGQILGGLVQRRSCAGRGGVRFWAAPPDSHPRLRDRGARRSHKAGRARHS